MKQLPYYVWTVKGRDYKLRLTAGGIIEVEQKIGSVYKIFGSFDADDAVSTVPELQTMLLVVQKAMTKYEHGIKQEDVLDLYDDYVDEGGNLVEFFSDVFMGVFQASGFFPKDLEPAEIQTEN